jgi:hypothetical protein
MIILTGMVSVQSHLFNKPTPFPHNIRIPFSIDGPLILDEFYRPIFVINLMQQSEN